MKGRAQLGLGRLSSALAPADGEEKSGDKEAWERRGGGTDGKRAAGGEEGERRKGMEERGRKGGREAGRN